MIDKTESTVFSIGESRSLLLDAAIDALKNISIPNGPALITYWGNKGIGKTALLTSIASRLETDYMVERIEAKKIDQHSVGEIEQAIWQQLNNISRDKFVLVLLDDIDELLRRESESFFDFELTMIQPLLKQGNVLILCTSQIELNQWREDDVRIRQVNHQVQALDYDEVVSLLANTGIPAKKIYKLTLGHPKVAGWLKEDPALTDRQLAGKAWAYFLEDIPADALSIAEIIYQFPVFNIFILQKTYETLTRAPLSYLDSLERVKEYIRRGLLYWDVSIGSYRFTDSAVRRLLARHILYTDPAKFDEVQRIASQYFRSEARSPGYLHMHFVSAIYHTAQAGRRLAQQATGQQCLEWFRSNRGFWLSARWTEVLSAWQKGANEQAVCDEIRDLVGTRQFNVITREIEAAKNSMEVNK